MRKTIQRWGLILAAVGGWITACALFLVMNSGEENFDVVNEALAKSLVERSDLKGELVRLRGQLEAAEQRMLVLEDRFVEAGSKLAGLPDHVRQKLAAGAAAKYMTVKRAKLRMGPSTQSQELAILSSDTPIEVLGLAAGGEWLEVVRVGYVHNDLLRPAQ